MTKRRNLSRCVAAVFAVLPAPAIAAPKESCTKDICVSGAWARATPPGVDNAAVYFTVTNKGRAADSLVSASSSITANAMVHRTVVTGGVAHMEMTGPVELTGGGQVSFAPIGYHLMLDGLKQPVKQGSTVSVTLNFANAGKLTFAVPVLSVTASGPPR
ncbi:MAG TPA: copper chaperone PCu(A)C [Micropepsaceae bacterium]|nr:copper chaperone PCu(A)C [Micropepsaceae bacterium]